MGIKISSEGLRLLFAVLREAGYEWAPQTPDLLLKFRKDPSSFRPIAQLFGLGLEVAEVDLLVDGIPEKILRLMARESFVRLVDQSVKPGEGVYKAQMAVSGSGEVFVVHDHWPPSPDTEGGYVHYAAESAWLSRALNRDLEGFIGKRVLDLGCSSGALSLEVAAVADSVLGLDVSKRAIEWGRLLAAAHGFKSIRLECIAVGSKEAELIAGPPTWDCMISNPPMVIPSDDAAYPHRDGGRLGIELPLLFLDYSYRHLKIGGEAQTLATNPIVKGRPAFFDSLPRGRWEFIEKRCLHPHFNQTVARKQGYVEKGISNVELWFLHLKKI